MKFSTEILDLAAYCSSLRNKCAETFVALNNIKRKNIRKRTPASVSKQKELELAYQNQRLELDQMSENLGSTLGLAKDKTVMLSTQTTNVVIKVASFEIGATPDEKMCIHFKGVKVHSNDQVVWTLWDGDEQQYTILD